ncbi:MAG: hypothetical protein H0X39_06240 [Actinobacteria bacterium]|nr:hypothetical protein [Actinomycetota bacterium]
MSKLITSMRGRFVAVAVVALGALVLVPFAGATTFDLSPATTSITAQITSTLPYVLGVGGSLLAIFIGWRLVKRFTH